MGIEYLTENVILDENLQQFLEQHDMTQDPQYIEQLDYYIKVLDMFQSFPKEDMDELIYA